MSGGWSGIPSTGTPGSGNIDYTVSHTPAEIVTAIDNAILALIMGVQSYSLLGRSVTYNDLDKLGKWRDYYAKRAANKADNGRNYAVLGSLDGRRDMPTPGSGI